MKRLALATSLIASVFLVSACGDDLAGSPDAASPEPDAAGPQAVAINFAAKVGAMDAVCGQTYTGLGVGSDQEIELKDFRFYVSNVRLINDANEEVAITLDQDTPFQTANVSMLDFEDKTGLCAAGTTETNSQVTGTVPPGTYNGIIYDVGVPFDLNHQDLVDLPSPLNIGLMYWVWAIGHKFIRIDMDVVGEDGDWNMHLGSTACGAMGPNPPPGTECDNPNIPTISIADFDPATDTVAFDLAPLLADSDLTSNVGMAPGCQSFPTDEADCTALFPNLGIDYATGDCMNGCADQSVFAKQ